MEPTAKKLRFRSYKPTTESLQPQVEEAPAMGEGTGADSIATTIQQTLTEVAVTSIEDLAPKKPNADLKRELQPRLDILDHRTRQAFARIITARVHNELDLRMPRLQTE